MSVVVPVEPESGESPESEALRRAVVAQFEQYVKLNKKIPQEILTSLTGIYDAGRLADTISAHLPLKPERQQKMLEDTCPADRLESLLSQVESAVDILKFPNRTRGRGTRQMETTQTDSYSTQSFKALQPRMAKVNESAD